MYGTTGFSFAKYVSSFVIIRPGLRNPSLLFGPPTEPIAVRVRSRIADFISPSSFPLRMTNSSCHHLLPRSLQNRKPETNLINEALLIYVHEK